jgi:hypothetical protein
MDRMTYQIGTSTFRPSVSDKSPHRSPREAQGLGIFALGYQLYPRRSCRVPDLPWGYR